MPPGFGCPDEQGAASAFLDNAIHAAGGYNFYGDDACSVPVRPSGNCAPFYRARLFAEFAFPVEGCPVVEFDTFYEAVPFEGEVIYLPMLGDECEPQPREPTLSYYTKGTKSGRRTSSSSRVARSLGTEGHSARELRRFARARRDEMRIVHRQHCRLWHRAVRISVSWDMGVRTVSWGQGAVDRFTRVCVRRARRRSFRYRRLSRKRRPSRHAIASPKIPERSLFSASSTAIRQALLGRGGEASVYALDEEHILRVSRPGATELGVRARAALLGELQSSAHRLSFSIPRVLEIDFVHDRWCTVERRLRGIPSKRSSR